MWISDRIEGMNYIQKVQDILAKKMDVEKDLLDLYTLIVFLKGERATMQDIHDAWSIWRNNTKPDHKSLIPFYKLEREIRELDREYTDAIQETAKEIIEVQEK